jgi:hypothetical protein
MRGLLAPFDLAIIYIIAEYLAFKCIENQSHYCEMCDISTIGFCTHTLWGNFTHFSIFEVSFLVLQTVTFSCY